MCGGSCRLPVVVCGGRMPPHTYMHSHIRLHVRQADRLLPLLFMLQHVRMCLKRLHEDICCRGWQHGCVARRAHGTMVAVAVSQGGSGGGRRQAWGWWSLFCVVK